MKLFKYILPLSILFLISCKNNSNKEKNIKQNTIVKQKTSINKNTVPKDKKPLFLRNKNEKVSSFINNVEKDLKIKLRVVSGYRSFSEQTTLYNQGRTTGGSIVTNAKAGSSNHNYGIAIDVCEIKGKVANWDVSMYKKIAPYAKKEGFEWGGDWKSFVDNPHFQMTNGKSTSDLLKLYNSNNKDYTKIKI